MGEGRRASWVRLLGERLCLDLVNSANWIGDVVADEPFETADDILTWLSRALPVNPTALEQWRGVLAERPAVSAALVARTVEARANLRRFLLAGETSEQGHPYSLDGVDRLFASGARPPPLSRAGLVCDGLADPEGSWFLDMAARSAFELVVSPDGLALRHCHGERCGWLFLDRSRSRRRRWCSMELCGNRAKTRAHYERWHGRGS